MRRLVFCPCLKYFFSGCLTLVLSESVTWSKLVAGADWPFRHLDTAQGPGACRGPPVRLQVPLLGRQWLWQLGAVRWINRELEIVTASCQWLDRWHSKSPQLHFRAHSPPCTLSLLVPGSAPLFSHPICCLGWQALVSPKVQSVPGWVDDGCISPEAAWWPHCPRHR